MAIQNIRAWSAVYDTSGNDVYTGPTTTNGNFLVIMASARSATAVITISDDGSNTWQKLPTSATDGVSPSNCFVYYVANANPITQISFSCNEVVTTQLQLTEWSGVAASDSIDASNGQFNASSLQPPPCQVTTTQGDCLVMGSIVVPVTSRTLTLQGTDYNQTGEVRAGQANSLFVYDLVDSATTTGPEWDITSGSSTSGSAMTVAFRSADTLNEPPTANAGSDTNATVSTLVTLYGSGQDSDGTVVSYVWTQTAGPTVTLSSTTVAQPTFTAPESPTTLTFSLVVTDNNSASSEPDTVTITVVEDVIEEPTARLVNINGQWIEVGRLVSVGGSWVSE